MVDFTKTELCTLFEHKGAEVGKYISKVVDNKKVGVKKLRLTLDSHPFNKIHMISDEAITQLIDNCHYLHTLEIDGSEERKKSINLVFSEVFNCSSSLEVLSEEYWNI